MRLPQLCQWVIGSGECPRRTESAVGMPAARGQLDLFAGLAAAERIVIRRLFAPLGYVLNGCFVNAIGMGTNSPAGSPPSKRSTSASYNAVPHIVERQLGFTSPPLMCNSRADPQVLLKSADHFYFLNNGPAAELRADDFTPTALFPGRQPELRVLNSSVSHSDGGRNRSGPSGTLRLDYVSIIS